MIKFLNRLLKKWYFPVSLKYVSLVAYIVLILTGLIAYSTDAAFLKQLRNTNLGNLIVWSYWWPSIIILAIFFGRIWCMVCPVEIITTFFSKIGLKRKRPKWLLSGNNRYCSHFTNLSKSILLWLPVPPNCSYFSYA